ncbi:MAG: helix-turn-helix domain-containing protein [Alphaproteobacteria bacterium]
MSKTGASILRGAKQALEYARGARDGFVAHVPERFDVKALRARLVLSQQAFAAQYGFTLDALQNWEQGRRRPDVTARALLKIIEREPEAVRRVWTQSQLADEAEERSSMAHNEKIFLNLAGEFAVAAELNRRKILASITYGASKSADIFAMNEKMDRFIRIEVKATDKKQWPVGHRILHKEAVSENIFWVFAKFPEPFDHADMKTAPSDSKRGFCAVRFYVLSSQEVHKIASEKTGEYTQRYLAKHKKPFPEGKGVPNVREKDIVRYEAAWHKVRDRLIRP